MMPNFSLSSADKAFIDSLMEARKADNKIGIANAFVSLAGLYLKNGEYVSAMLLYRSAFTLMPAGTSERLSIEKKMLKVENRFLTEACRRKAKIVSSKVYDSELEKIIEITRNSLSTLDNIPLRDENDFRSRAKSVDNIYEEINNRLVTFLKNIFSDCESILAKPPGLLRYSLISLGSFAKKRATPFSDIEFAILIGKESDSEVNEKYLKNLSVLFAFKIIRLGYTAIPLNFFKIDGKPLNLYFDDLLKPGLQFDLGGKTPLGREDKEYKLIQTPAGMVKYLADNAFAADKFLPVELSNCRHLFGDAILTEEYLACIHDFFRQPLGDIPTYKARAIKILCEGLVDNMTGDLESYHPRLIGEDYIEGLLYNVKKELYRVPDRFLEGLALYYGIVSGTIWQKLDELLEKRCLNKDAVNNLKVVEAISAEIRLRAYMKYRSQCERMSVMESIPMHSISEPKAAILEDIFCLPNVEDENHGLLFRFYYTIIPLYKKLSDLHKIEYHGSSCLNLSEINFLDDSDFVKGMIYARLMRYKEAASHLEKPINVKFHELEQRIRKHEKISGWEVQDLCINIQLLAVCYRKMQHYEEERQTLDKINRLFLKIRARIIHLNPDYVAHNKNGSNVAQDIIQILATEEHNKAVFKHNEALNRLSCGEFKQALDILLEVLKIYKKLYPNGHLFTSWSYSSMGTVCLLWSEYFWQVNDQLNLNKYRAFAHDCFNRAMNIYQILLATPTGENKERIHLNIGRLLINWANLNNLERKHLEAKRQCDEALMIFKRFFGEIHPDVAKIYSILGDIYGYFLNDQKSQYDYYKIAEYIYSILIKRKAGDPFELIDILVKQSNMYRETREYSKAYNLIQQAYLDFKNCIALTNIEEIGITQSGIGQICEFLKREKSFNLIKTFNDITGNYERLCLKAAYSCLQEHQEESAYFLVLDALSIWQVINFGLDTLISKAVAKYNVPKKAFRSTTVVSRRDEYVSDMILTLARNAGREGRSDEVQEFQKLNGFMLSRRDLISCINHDNAVFDILKKISHSLSILPIVTKSISDAKAMSRFGIHNNTAPTSSEEQDKALSAEHKIERP